MKRLLVLSALSCAFFVQATPAFADATGAQKQEIEKARKQFSEVVKTEEGCKAMCEEMMKNEKSKRMMCEMIAKDPECMKLIKAK